MNTRNILMAGAAVLAVTLASGAQAHAQTTGGSPQSGLYAGGFGGFDWSSADVAGAPSFGMNGGDYGVFAGYQMGSMLSNRNFGLTGAIEFEYGWTGGMSETKTVAGNPFTVEKNHEWGVDLRPGLSFISDDMPLGLKPYGIVGYRQAEFETKSIAGNSSDNHPGFELGLGTELVAYRNFGVRVDYEHVFYKSDSGVDPDENDLRAGLVYHF